MSAFQTRIIAMSLWQKIARRNDSLRAQILAKKILEPRTKPNARKIQNCSPPESSLVFAYLVYFVVYSAFYIEMDFEVPYFMRSSFEFAFIRRGFGARVSKPDKLLFQKSERIELAKSDPQSSRCAVAEFEEFEWPSTRSKLPLMAWLPPLIKSVPL